MGSSNSKRLQNEQVTNQRLRKERRSPVLCPSIMFTPMHLPQIQNDEKRNSQAISGTDKTELVS